MTCRKIPHATYAGAAKAAETASKFYNDHLVAYRCGKCSLFHIGHPSTKD